MPGRSFLVSRLAGACRLALLAMTALLLAQVPSASQPVMQPKSNVNLPGGDYRNFWATDWSYCASACKAEGQCTAWTWVRPRVQGGSGRCWLKNKTTAERQESCCISGVKLTDQRRSTMEYGINRPGSDIRYVLMPPNGTPWDCKAVCERDGLCNSWTFVHPGIQGPEARCWLKRGVPPAKRESCCTSGVKPS